MSNVQCRIQKLCISSDWMFGVRRSAFSSSQNNRLTFGHDEHFILNALSPRSCLQTLEWLLHRFKAETEGPVMHRDQSFRAKLGKRSHCLFRIHVDLAAGRCVVSANRQQRDIDLITLADFSEAGKKRAIATMKN